MSPLVSRNVALVLLAFVLVVLIILVFTVFALPPAPVSAQMTSRAFGLVTVNLV